MLPPGVTPVAPPAIMFVTLDEIWLICDGLTKLYGAIIMWFDTSYLLVARIYFYPFGSCEVCCEP